MWFSLLLGSSPSHTGYRDTERLSNVPSSCWQPRRAASYSSVLTARQMFSFQGFPQNSSAISVRLLTGPEEHTARYHSKCEINFYFCCFFCSPSCISTPQNKRPGKKRGGRTGSDYPHILPDLFVLRIIDCENSKSSWLFFFFKAVIPALTLRKVYLGGWHNGSACKCRHPI